MSYTAPVKDMLFAIEHLANIERDRADSRFRRRRPGHGRCRAGGVRAKFNEGRAGSAQLGRRQNPSSWKDGVVTTTPASRRPTASTPRAAGRPAAPADPWRPGPAQDHRRCLHRDDQQRQHELCVVPAADRWRIEALLTAGSDELKATYLEKLVTGQWTGMMNLTEPQAGSGPGLVRTRAEPQPDGTYKIFGTKIFITYGEHDMAENIVHLVLARVRGAPRA